MICRNHFLRPAREQLGLALRKCERFDSWSEATYGIECSLTASLVYHGKYSDRVMGGVSMGNLSREVFDGRTANVLRGSVSLANNGGFIQMATNLAPASGETSSVDASSFQGVELDVQSFSGEDGSESFNVQ
jgi:Complex I intermediate-associated protein 30 (CIA30)